LTGAGCFCSLLFFIDKIDTSVYNLKKRHKCRKKRVGMATKKEKTRESILDAAYGLFAGKGFKQVTMKDVCEAADMSRGGLYSHFSGTDQIFEALLERITQNDAMDFQAEMNKGTSAVKILERAISQMEKEMKHSEDSLSIAIYEYAEIVDSDMLEQLNRRSEERWSALIRYGISSGEFRNVDVNGLVNMILFSYQGVRMWSRIVPMKPKTFRSITDLIKKSLIA